MPEGPEVHYAVDILKDRLVGKMIIGVYLASASRYWGMAKQQGFPGMEYLECAMLIQGIIARGKKIVFFLATPTKQLRLISSLGMEGRWLYSPQSHTSVILQFGMWFWENLGEGRGIWVKRITDHLYYDDSRRFGNLTLVDGEAAYIQVMKEVGPDWLSNSITREDFYQRIRQKRIRSQEICKFLMNQKYFSGIGNYLKAEILFASRLLPNRTLESLRNEDIDILYYYLRTIPTQSYANKGHTSRTYLSPDGQPGQFQVSIYRKEMCPNGGHPITSYKFSDGRTTWFCSNCQH